MTRRLLHLTTVTAAAALLVPAAAAQGATPAPLPVVVKVEPLRLGIGDTMTITGRNFRRGSAKNTVIFKRDGKRAVFVPVATATPTKLKFTIPEKLRSSLSRSGGTFVATRFRLRVLSHRFAKRYTTLSGSPVIVPLATQPGATAPAPGATAPAATAGPATTAPAPAPAAPPPDCDGDGIVDAADTDDDADLLPDTVEQALRTEVCNRDSDADGMEDGWEYQSAIDLNSESCPTGGYPTPCAAARPAPVKRPYTNPLYPDTGVDYDGDWLPAGHEYAAWKRKGVRSLTNLWYSDGRQASQDTTPGGCRGVDAALHAPLMGQVEYSIDRDRDGCLNDAERDEDNDFLTNDEEVAGQLSASTWWNTFYEEPAFHVVYAGTDWLDPDSDGDGVVDGIDDQDFDDFWNVEEMRRGTVTVDKQGNANSARSGLWVDPFNPCLPSKTSRTCPTKRPLTGEPWRPYTSHTATEPVKPRWPLYGTPQYPGEQWDGKPAGDQTMPPQHPLLPLPE